MDPRRSGTTRDAMATALTKASFLFASGINLAWLTDELGQLVWSLRMDEINIDE
jgi:hypothetical protein